MKHLGVPRENVSYLESSPRQEDSGGTFMEKVPGN